MKLTTLALCTVALSGCSLITGLMIWTVLFVVLYGAILGLYPPPPGE